MSPQTRNRIIGLFVIAIGLGLLLHNYRLGRLGILVYVMVLALTAFAFAWYFLTDDRLWWTILIAGVLLTQSVVLLLTFFHIIPNSLISVIILLGMSLTLLLLWLDRRTQAKFSWTLYPALLLICATALSYLKHLDVLPAQWIVPLLFLTTGILVIYIQYRKKSGS